jgi:hypothetical protein
LSEESFLSDDFLRQLISVGDVDLMVGMPSRNDVKTVAAVVRAIEEGVLRNYGRERVVLVNVDGGSRDGTLQALTEASSLGKGNARRIETLRTLRWITASVGQDAAPGEMLRTVLAAADLLHTKGCAVIAASSENAAPSWVSTLLTPVHVEDYDFVAPLYSRHKFDGLLTRNLLYPASRALYGKPVRELRANEFAFSGRFATHCLAQEKWHNEAVQGGAEMWMAINAIANSYRCCQTYLGVKPRSSSGANVVAAIRQTVSGLFWCMEATESYWQSAVDPEELHTVGPDHQLTSEPMRIDRKKVLEMFKSGVAELSTIHSAILDPDTHAELLRLAGAGETDFRLTNPLWVRIIFEFAAAYHHSVMNREHLVQALVPIYRGRVCSFLAQHRNSGADALESDLEQLCREFANQKAFLIERWKAKGESAS